MKNYFVITKINKEIDKKVCFQFIDDAKDFDFGKINITNLHPNLTKARNQKKERKRKIISDYINKFYFLNKKELFLRKEFVRESWEKIEKKYFEEVKKLFNNKIYLNYNNFTAYLSIFTCCPIIFPNKFQVYYKFDTSQIKKVFSHEIMHFFYYSYTEKNPKIAKLYNSMNLDEKWTKAEIFNVIVLNLPQFQKIIRKKEEGYEIHKKYFKTFRNFWQKSKNLDDFLIKTARLKLK